MTDTHAVISAFLDDEPFDAAELAAALSDPAGRTLLIDLVALRHIVQPDEPAATAAAGTFRSRWRPLLATAAMLVALAGGYVLGDRRSAVESSEPPAPTRVVQETTWQSSSNRRRTMKRVTILMLFVQLIGVAVARAQTAEDLEVAVSVLNVQTNGAEKLAGGSLTTGPVSKKGSSDGRFSVRPCGAFSIEARAEGAFAEGATTGWRVHITPLGMNDGAVKFRLQWIRALDTGKEMSAKSEDVELTLRPGESRSLDSVSVPPDKNTGRPCPIWDNRGKQIELSRVGLRVSVEYTPHESLERRLVGVDLWLIERVGRGR